MTFVCPVCGYDGLSSPPYSDGAASFEICPACGVEFGVDDQADYDRHRQEWIARGMPWYSVGKPRPRDWVPRARLASLPRYQCPVCGYDGLYDPAYDAYGAPRLSPCECCGTEFGVDDRLATIEQLRAKWITTGMPWRSRTIRAPAGWDAVAQLAKIRQSH